MIGMESTRTKSRIPWRGALFVVAVVLVTAVARTRADQPKTQGSPKEGPLNRAGPAAPPSVAAEGASDLRLLAGDEAAAMKELERRIVDDPHRIHATALHTRNQMGWKWTVYLLPGKAWQINGAVGRILGRGHSPAPRITGEIDIGPSATGRIMKLEGHISHSFDDPWVLMVEADRRVFDANEFAAWGLSSHIPRQAEVLDYLLGKRKARSFEGGNSLAIGGVTTKINDRLQLVRWRYNPKDEKTMLGDPLPGFCIWIDAKQNDPRRE